jgi:hypothetical protein
LADWVLIPSLKSLFAAFDKIAPSRDHTSDGSIGDTAHQDEVSDHNPDETGNVPIYDADHINEVHAIDVDTELRESDLTMEKVVQFLLGRCRSGAEKRLRYMIYNRRIWEASNGWRERQYTGPSPHTEHAHFSGSYDTNLEASTASWHLEDIPVALTDADKTWITNTVNNLVKPAALTGADGKPDGTYSTQVGHYAWSQGIPSPFEPDGGRVPAYDLLEEVAKHVKALVPPGKAV